MRLRGKSSTEMKRSVQRALKTKPQAACRNEGKMAKYEPSHLKTMNTKIVFREFRSRSEEGLFINEIARISKISVPTVMKIVEFLVKKELVRTEECTKTRVGRKPNMLKLNKDKYFSIGVIYEGDYLSLGIVDLAGNVYYYVQVRCGKHFEDSLIMNIDRLLEISGRKINDLIGIGIGMPCVFDKNKCEIIAPLLGIDEPQYFGDKMEEIAARYKTKVFVDNDLNIQAFGEYAYIKPDTKEDLIFISLGTGLGAGVIIDGKARRGNRNICGEIGHMMFEYSEEDEKAGWLENKINLKALEERFGIVNGYVPSEEKQREAVEYVSEYLALLINNLIFSYDVSNIVLSGPVIEALGGGVIEQTQKKLDKICYRSLGIRQKKAPLPGISGAGLLAGNIWLDDLFR